jgi:hypothetical protein
MSYLRYTPKKISKFIKEENKKKNVFIQCIIE